jgi:branched-chain amino acid aminotransferase
VRINRVLKKNSDLQSVTGQDLGFGNFFSDHMLVREWADDAWGDATIRPRAALEVEPTALGIQYGQSVFEGLKAYRGTRDGIARLFRPDRNAARLEASCFRLCIPPISPKEFVECITEIVSVESCWIPEHRGHALYLRPLVFANEGHLAVRPSSRYLFVITAAPVAPYFSSSSPGLRLKAEARFTRAAMGGTGASKTSGNYAPTLQPMASASQDGFDQILWLDAQEHAFAEEAGQMNVFFRIGDEVVTPELSGTILPGITRESVITLLESWGITTRSRRVSMAELADASRSGELLEIFGAGTAAVVAPVTSISHLDKEISVAPQIEESLAQRLRETLLGIQHGEIDDPYNWVVPVS